MADPCCALCRTPSGVCLSRYSCNHHKEADAQDEANHQARRTHSDPTAYAAIANAMRDTRPNRSTRP
ncbi:hypothetical protein SEA_BRAYBEAST_57 [Arthrobacter phage BrayBeast]